MDKVIYTGWRRVLDDENDPSTWADEYHQVHYYEDAQRDPGDGVLEIELFEDGSGEVTIKKGVTWIAVEQAIEHFRNVIIPQQVANGHVEKDRLWKSLKIEIEAADKPISVSHKKTSRKLGGSNGSIRRKKKNNSHTNAVKRSRKNT